MPRNFGITELIRPHFVAAIKRGAPDDGLLVGEEGGSAAGTSLLAEGRLAELERRSRHGGPSGEEYEEETWNDGLTFEECIDNDVLQGRTFFHPPSCIPVRTRQTIVCYRLYYKA